MVARGEVSCVNKNGALYKRSRVNVKVMRGSTFTFTRSLSNITSILFARKLSTRTHVKITRQWKSTLIDVPVEVGLHVCGTRNRRYVSRFQASGGKREAGGECETRATEKGAQKIITSRARLVLYARFALAFARLKNGKKKYSASYKKRGSKTGVTSLQSKSIGFKYLFYTHCTRTVFGFSVFEVSLSCDKI